MHTYIILRKPFRCVHVRERVFCPLWRSIEAMVTVAKASVVIYKMIPTTVVCLVLLLSVGICQEAGMILLTLLSTK